VKLALGLVVLFAASACGGHSSKAMPYQVQFVNDTLSDVRIVGCANCGDGHLLLTGGSWLTSVGGGATDVTFTHGGVTTGCVHFRNGVLPTSSAPPSVIRVSDYSACVP
jgi:hypothetical protein